MKQISENKVDILVRRVQSGEKLDVGDLLILMDSLIQKKAPAKEKP
jgi:hypothetical protein